MTAVFAEKTVLLGVCGSIAAYKACDLASRLVEQGAEVLTALTQSAQRLIQPAAFEAITGNRAIAEMFTPIASPEIEHISVARRAHLFLIAPATANVLAKAAHGLADDWLSTALLATRAPVLFAPAMNTAMYEHPATQANIALLRERGASFVGPGIGRLACGAVGPGRLADVTDILDAAVVAAHPVKDFAGKRVLITSGPNLEPIDPVRYIGNRSSGKMGRALALEALRRGARVCMISGPVAAQPPYGVEVIPASTAKEMFDAALSRMDAFDIFIAAAAVADYRVEKAADAKIKRSGEPLRLALIPNPDIVAAVAKARRPGQIIVGFAAESQDLLPNAAKKLSEKGLDMIVANTVGGARCAIGADAGEAWILAPGKTPEALGAVDKTDLARRIFDGLAATSAPAVSDLQNGD